VRERVSERDAREKEIKSERGTKNINRDHFNRGDIDRNQERKKTSEKRPTEVQERRKVKREKTGLEKDKTHLELHHDVTTKRHNGDELGSWTSDRNQFGFHHYRR
jgi:hypothetical protein